jgi:hypothetical protein
MKKSNKLTLYIIVAMVAGIVLGYVIHTQSSPEFIKSFSTNIKLLTTIFLRLGTDDHCPAGIFNPCGGHCQTGRPENGGQGRWESDVVVHHRFIGEFVAGDVTG